MTDAELSGLLDGLAPAARAERAELLEWLLEQGFTVEEIRSSFSPMLLPARRALGDDGSAVSAREISEQTGLELEQLIRFQRAAGLPQVDDPDVAFFVRSDGDSAVHIKRFLDLGFDPDLMLAVVRVLAQGLANASEVMSVAALAAVLRPGASELDTARGTGALVSAAAPLLGPMIEDLLLLQLRRTLETEAVNAGERAAGAPQRLCWIPQLLAHQRLDPPLLHLLRRRSAGRPLAGAAAAARRFCCLPMA
jgi:adenylate cyclase